jgi:hypothetical protein
MGVLNEKRCKKKDEITGILEQIHETTFLLEKMRENSAHLSIPPHQTTYE